MAITYKDAEDKVAAALREIVSQLGEFAHDWDDDEYHELAAAAVFALFGEGEIVGDKESDNANN
jgi:hypothetical protein